MKNKGNKKEEAITLIALVITIIILLILAGVSIAMLTGNNGILKQAKLAKENTQLAKEDEENKLANNNGYINEQIGNAVPGKVVIETKKDNYVDSNGDKATIPADFMVDETENTISKGLVVHGPDKVNGDNGSEFVWVPVSDINLMSQCSTAGGNCNLQLENGILKCKTHDDNEEIVGKLYSTVMKNNYIDDTANTDYNSWNSLKEPVYLEDQTYGDASSENNTIGLTEKYLKNEYKAMATSVAKYGGFYVGRYELSLSNATSSEAKDGKAQSKQGVIPTAANNEATYKWYGLYQVQNKTYETEKNSVESSMIWGSQYDAILNWAKNGKNETAKERIVKSSLGNNSSQNVTVTGSNAYANDNINNIRDLGGNLFEWTLEGYYGNHRILRGGNFENGSTPSYRDGNYPGARANWSGSRLALYII